MTHVMSMSKGNNRHECMHALWKSAFSHHSICNLSNHCIINRNWILNNKPWLPDPQWRGEQTTEQSLRHRYGRYLGKFWWKSDWRWIDPVEYWTEPIAKIEWSSVQQTRVKYFYWAKRSFDPKNHGHHCSLSSSSKNHLISSSPVFFLSFFVHFHTYIT